MKEEGIACRSVGEPEWGRGAAGGCGTSDWRWGGVEGGRVGQPLRPHRQTGARQLIRGIGRRALRQAKGPPDQLKKNRKNI